MLARPVGRSILLVSLKFGAESDIWVEHIHVWGC